MDKTSEELLIKRKKSCIFTNVLLFCGFMYFFASCEKGYDISGNSNEHSLSKGEPVTVNFMVSENNFNNPITSRKGEASSNSPEGIGGSFLISGESEEAIFMYAVLKEEVTPIQLRAEILNTGTKVRVVAYTDTGSGYIDMAGFADFEVAAGGVLLPDGPSMTVPVGTCRFVAYSYNNADPMPAFADMTVAIDPLDLLWGETLPITVGPGNNTVYLLLEHWFSQVKLHVELHHTTLNKITDVQVANVNHTFPELEVNTGNLIAGTTGQIPFVWQSGQNAASDWYSIDHQIFTDGGYPVVTIGNVVIDGTTYPGPWEITYNTPLTCGHQYTLHIYFMEDEILCGELESPELDIWGDY